MYKGVWGMLDNYEQFKKEVYALTKIDLNCYKEKQMRRRIDTLITKNKISDYDSYVALIKKDKAEAVIDSINKGYYDRFGYPHAAEVYTASNGSSVIF